MCALDTVTIPRSLNRVEDYAFYNCPALSRMFYDGALSDYATIYVGTGNENLDDAAILSLPRGEV